MNNNQQRRNNSSVSMSQLTMAVKKHTHGVVLSSLLFAVGGIMLVSLLPDVYRATTTILVDPQKIPEKYVSSTVTTDPNARLDTLTQQVLSGSLLEGIIERDNLYPKLRRQRSREEVLDYMREKTKIEIKQSPEPEQGLSSFSISYEDRDPRTVALVTNQLAAGFIDWNLKVRQQEAIGTTQFLSTELQTAKEGLEEQEHQLESFKMKHAGATPDDLNGNLQALSRLQADAQSNMDAISRLDEERILISRGASTEAQAVPLTDRERMLQEKRRLETERLNLKRQFTDKYPDVIANGLALQEVNARLAELPEPAQNSEDTSDRSTSVRLALIEKNMGRHKEQLAVLAQQIQSYQAKVDSVPILQTQMVELTRNYEASRQNYQSLLDKTFSAGMSEELERKQQAERFTVLDPARKPEKPVQPQRIPIMAGVLVFALILPAGSVASFYLLKGFIMSESEVRQMLPPGIPILGIVPSIQSKGDLRRARLRMLRTVAVSVVACTGLFIALYKIRPIL